MNISHLLNNNLKDYYSYDNVRSLGCLCDGLKNASRKLVQNCKDTKNFTKVMTLANSTALNMQYLHNPDILNTILQDLSNANFLQLPLFTPLSGVGTRTNPRSASPRYSSIKSTDYLNQIFKPFDFNDNILTSQTFEGSKIEYKTLAPTLPLILINGSSGVSAGFAQNIIPRDIKDVLKALKEYIKLKSIKQDTLKPMFPCYKGSIEFVKREDTKCQWKFTGSYKKLSNTKLLIDEVPPYMTDEKLITHLNKLKDNKVIKSYVDGSVENDFKCEVSVHSEFWNEYDTDEKVIKVLGLVTTDTETFVCVDENNHIKSYKSEIEILKAFADYKLRCMSKRKSEIIRRLEAEIDSLKNRILFISAVNDGRISLKQSKDEIITQMGKVGINPAYNTRLLELPLYSLSKEKVAEFEKNIQLLTEKHKEMSDKSIEDMWLEDINSFEKGMG